MGVVAGGSFGGMNVDNASSYAPGRVELLGNHTDYNEGVVLAAALNLGVTMTGRKRGDGMLRAVSADIGREAETDLADIRTEAGEEWAGYVFGVVQVLREAGYPVGALEVELSSTVPPGAGLSSSAALEVATAMLVSKLFALEIPPMDLAKLCRRAENTFMGVNCGLLDQATSIFGRDGHAVMLDCREESVRAVPLPSGVALLIVNSNVRHELTGGEYNERRDSCFAAAKALGVAALRDVSPAQLETAAADLEEIPLRRARHVVGECDRVTRGVDLLGAGKAAAFGQLMFESHESSIRNFENSTPELDALVDIARGLPGVYGSRLSGGGFGGATVSLVDEAAVGSVSEEIVARYRERTGIGATALRCHASGGAR